MESFICHTKKTVYLLVIVKLQWKLMTFKTMKIVTYSYFCSSMFHDELSRSTSEEPFNILLLKIVLLKAISQSKVQIYLLILHEMPHYLFLFLIQYEILSRCTTWCIFTVSSEKNILPSIFDSCILLERSAHYTIKRRFK